MSFPWGLSRRFAMVYISGANKNRLGKRRFDALFDAGCGQVQQDNGNGKARRHHLADLQQTAPGPRPAGFPPAIDQG
ncbi:hypothetical protein [Rhizobium aouanii]|uniref:hypothetical protein n=1 Tax=Rhizobium aouanii TaxID=3118145 RepID=UPI0030070026